MVEQDRPDPSTILTGSRRPTASKRLQGIDYPKPLTSKNQDQPVEEMEDRGSKGPLSVTLENGPNASEGDEVDTGDEVPQKKGKTLVRLLLVGLENSLTCWVHGRLVAPAQSPFTTLTLSANPIKILMLRKWLWSARRKKAKPDNVSVSRCKGWDKLIVL